MATRLGLPITPGDWERCRPGGSGSSTSFISSFFAVVFLAPGDTGIDRLRVSRCDTFHFADDIPALKGRATGRSPLRGIRDANGRILSGEITHRSSHPGNPQTQEFRKNVTQVIGTYPPGKTALRFDR